MFIEHRRFPLTYFPRVVSYFGVLYWLHTLLLELMKIDDFVKSPSVPLGAGLRSNFVVAAHL